MCVSRVGAALADSGARDSEVGVALVVDEGDAVEVALVDAVAVLAARVLRVLRVLLAGRERVGEREDEADDRVEVPRRVGEGRSAWASEPKGTRSSSTPADSSRRCIAVSA